MTRPHFMTLEMGGEGGCGGICHSNFSFYPHPYRWATSKRAAHKMTVSAVLNCKRTCRTVELSV